VPVGFLTDEQRRRYGRFHGEPTPHDLARYFHLDDSDRNLIALHRGDQNRLGFAVQLCSVRYLGTFLEDLTETPAAVVAILERQLDIQQSNCFAEYCTNRQRWDHTVEIRQHCGYGEFSDGATQFRLNRWLYALCWTGTERPVMLFDRATAPPRETKR
jgi:TnpA family transposase